MLNVKWKRSAQLKRIQTSWESYRKEKQRQRHGQFAGPDRLHFSSAFHLSASQLLVFQPSRFNVSRDQLAGLPPWVVYCTHWFFFTFFPGVHKSASCTSFSLFLPVFVLIPLVPSVCLSLSLCFLCLFPPRSHLSPALSTVSLCKQTPSLSL